MLYYLLYPLREIWFGFNVFRYITFRAALGAVTAFLVSVILGPYIIRWLYALKIGQQVRKGQEMEKLSSFHKLKEGTPTMGGILILLAVVVSTLLWADIFNKYILLVLFSTLWLGTIGLVDDALKMIKKNRVVNQVVQVVYLLWEKLRNQPVNQPVNQVVNQVKNQVVNPHHLPRLNKKPQTKI